MFIKGSQARHVPALFNMHEPRTDLDAILQICTLRSAPAVATRPCPPPIDTASAVTGMAWAEKEQKGATPPLHTDATLHTCEKRSVKRSIAYDFCGGFQCENHESRTRTFSEADHLHKTIVSTSDNESGVVRGCNT